MDGNADRIKSINAKRDLIYVGAVAVLIIAITLIFGHGFSSRGDRIRIEVDGQLMGEYPLDQDIVISVPDDKNATNIISIEASSARMIEADCPDKLCIHQGSINKQGQTIVCLPNKVVVTVISDKEPGYDTIAR